MNKVKTSTLEEFHKTRNNDSKTRELKEYGEVESSVSEVAPMDLICQPDSELERTLLFSKEHLRELLRGEKRSTDATKKTMRSYVLIFSFTILILFIIDV